MKKIKKIFSSEIGDALQRAREDERAKCNEEKEKALDRQEKRIVGEWFLKLKESESEIKTLNLRLEQMANRESLITEERQSIREIGIDQRRIASDIIYVAENLLLEFTKLIQEFYKLKTDANNCETKLIRHSSQEEKVESKIQEGR